MSVPVDILQATYQTQLYNRRASYAEQNIQFFFEGILKMVLEGDDILI